MADTTYALRVHEPGGPEVMVGEEVAIGSPGPDEVRLRHTAIGVNFIDIYQRRGLYPLALPFTPGSEAAGIVEAVGRNVYGFRPGDRVAYADAIGAYCTYRLIPAAKLIHLPDGIPDQTAAAVMLKGLTAEYLLRRAYRLERGAAALIHAAAGGVGLIAGQWAAALGATVIGTVGTDEKAALAERNGYDHLINYRSGDFVARTKEITNGRGVDVVYDSVGKDTFPLSLDVIRPRGTWVSFGQSSGPLPDFSPLLLAQKGSLFMTRPRLADYIADPVEFAAAATTLFQMISDGPVKVEVSRVLPLADAAEAHRAIETRQTTGATVLVP